MTSERPAEQPLWFFGYGSLIWRPDFPFLEQQPARLSGFIRRFWQGSPDHRGTPSEPGRVVTLVPDPTGYCDGVAFRVLSDHLQSILEYLDERESGGYTRIISPIDMGHIVHATVYVANQNNPHYLGPADLDQMAQHIVRSQGPSGTNLQYLTELARSLDNWRIKDKHVLDLHAQCLRIQHCEGVWDER